MTSIAWDGKTLAVDSRITQESFITSDKAEKLHLLEGVTYNGDELLCVALGGDSADADAYLEYLKSDKFPCEVKHYVSGIIIGQKYAYIVDGSKSHLIRLPKDELLGEGSGGMIVLSAMKLGLSAVEAVQHAMLLDAATGGEVRSVTLE